MHNKLVAIITGFLLIIFSSLGWFYTYTFLNNTKNSWGTALIFFILFLNSFLVLAVLNKKYCFIAFGISLIPALIIGKNLWLIPFLIASATLFYLGLHFITRDLKNSIKLRLNHSLKNGYSLLTTAFCLAISSMYFFYALSHSQVKPLEISISIPEVITTQFLRITQYSPDLFYSLSPDETVDEFIVSSITINDPEETVSTETIEEKRKELSSKWGLALSGTENMAQVFNQVINNYVNQHIKSFTTDPTNVTPFILASGLFVTLKATLWLLRQLFIFISWAILKTFLKSKLISIKKKEVLAETLE